MGDIRQIDETNEEIGRTSKIPNEKKYKILHIDDDRDFLWVFGRNFSKWFDIVSVTDFQFDIREIRTGGYDAIILDYDMPRANGLEIIRSIKREFPDMPVIFFTGQGNEEIARQAFLSGASDYFVKNILEFAQKEKIVNSVIRSIEQKKAEYKLRKEQERSQLYFETAGVMLIAIDANQQVTMINKKGCEILGYQKEEIIGKNWFDNFLPEKYRKELKDIFENISRGVEFHEKFVNPILTKSGEERIISWYNTILKDDDGNIIGTLSSGEDITERVRMEENLRKLLRARQMLNECHEVILHSTDESNLLTSICNIIVEEGGFQVVCIGCFKGKEKIFFQSTKACDCEDFCVDMGFLEEMIDEKSPINNVILTGKPQVVNNIQIDPKTSAWWSQFIKMNISSYALIPMITQGETIGILNIFARETDAFNAEEVDLLTELAGDIAFGISAIRTKLERDRILNDLYESEKRIRESFELLKKIGINPITDDKHS